MPGRGEQKQVVQGQKLYCLTTRRTDRFSTNKVYSMTRTIHTGRSWRSWSWRRWRWGRRRSRTRGSRRSRTRGSRTRGVGLGAVEGVGVEAVRVGGVRVGGVEGVEGVAESR